MKPLQGQVRSVAWVVKLQWRGAGRGFLKLGTTALSDSFLRHFTIDCRQEKVIHLKIVATPLYYV